MPLFLTTVYSIKNALPAINRVIAGAKTIRALALKSAGNSWSCLK
jgi:hypothetical protein